MPSHTKLMTVSKAIRTYVKPNSCLSIGGFTISRNPMALVYEIVRQKIGGLHLAMHSGSQAMDILVGSGLVELLEIAYGANGRLAPTCIRFRRAVEEGTLSVEDYSNYQMTLRFMAGAMGVPFLPTFSGLGSDIVNQWGFDTVMRKSRPDLPTKKVTIVDNPFNKKHNPVVLVPAINSDVTIIHAQKASEEGTVRIQGLTFADIQQAKASKHVIVSCEELVSSEQIREEPWRNSLPHVLVDAVVHQPFGAHPTACYLNYDYDLEHLTEYRAIAENDDRFNGYLQKFIYSTDCFDEYLKLFDSKSLERIRASPKLGYARRTLN